ncbi:MAG: hypothetical protein DMF96_01755 [Acidobacteria bacterium]|nr:MAG: hypothetical protein DMF96_01755 [Acidobacteriota bacterium]
MCPSTRGSRRPMVSDSLLPLAGRTVLGIFAHPDDESLACGGTLARLADAGARVILLCASHGEAGSISDPALVPDGNLGAVRARELRDAAAVLGIAEVILLDHPDGDLRTGSTGISITSACTSARSRRSDRSAPPRRRSTTSPCSSA